MNTRPGCGEIQEVVAGGDWETLKALLKGDPDLVFIRDTNGMTLLRLAAMKGRKDVVELLLANQAELNARNENGATPLHMALVEGHQDVAELLREHGGHE